MNLKRSCAAILCAISLLGLSACGLTGPKNAAEMFDAYRASVVDTGFHMSGDITATASMDYMDYGATMDMTIPVTISLDMDAFNDAMHGTVKISSSLFGMDFSQETEVYSVTEDGVTKTYMNAGEDTWAVSESEDYKGFGTLSESADALFEKGDGVYVVTARLSELISEEQFAELLDGMSDELAETDGWYIEDMLDNSGVEYTFDAKNNYLLSIHMDELNFGTYVSDEDLTVDEQTLEENTEGEVIDPEIPLTIDFKLAIDLNFDSYGEVYADDVALPDEIRDSALSTANDSISLF